MDHDLGKSKRKKRKKNGDVLRAFWRAKAFLGRPPLDTD
jgi:hypothetical protein